MRLSADQVSLNIERIVNDLSLLKTLKVRKAWKFSRHRRSVVGMITILSALVSLRSFRVRSRASLEAPARRPATLTLPSFSVSLSWAIMRRAFLCRQAAFSRKPSGLRYPSVECSL